MSDQQKCRIDTPQIKWPCQGCEDRFPGCHANCERYAETKAEHKKLKEAARAENFKPTADARELFNVRRRMRRERYKSNHKPNH